MRRATYALPLLAALTTLESKLNAQDASAAYFAKQVYSSQLSSNIFNMNVTDSDTNYIANGTQKLETICNTNGILQLAAVNQAPGTEIWVLETDELNHDPRVKHWNPVYNFVANSSRELFNMQIADGTHFFRLLQIDTYNGPDIKIMSPRQGQNVSGDFDIAVSPGTDIFNLEKVSLYVNGNVIPSAGSNDLNFHYESRMAMNGPIMIQASAVNSMDASAYVPDGESSSDPMKKTFYSKTVPVVAANEFFVLNGTDYSYADTSVPLQFLSLTPQTVKVTMTEHGGTNSATTVVSSDPDAFFPYHYTSMNAALPTGMSASMVDTSITYTNTTSSNYVIITMVLDRVGVNMGKGFYAFGEWQNSTYNNMLLDDIGSCASYHYGLAVTDPAVAFTRVTAQQSNPFWIEVKRNRNQQGIDECYDTFRDTKVAEFSTKGHGGTYIWVGRGGSLDVGLNASTIAQILGNTSTNYTTIADHKLTFHKADVFGRRMFFGDIEGCMTISEPSAAMGWPECLGVPQGYNMNINKNVAPNACFGFTDIAYLSQSFCNFQKDFHTLWESSATPIPLGLAQDQATFIRPWVNKSGATIVGCIWPHWIDGKRYDRPYF